MDSVIEANFSATVWRHPAAGGWCFLSLPVDVADEIRSRVEPAGFGSVRVSATIGQTTWATSVFPDKARGSYVLPVKAAVRRAEGIDTDEPIDVHLVVAV